MTTDLKISNWSHELAHAIPDPEVGISLAALAGNDEFTSYAVELKPGTNVAPHYHLEGIEIYQILSGKGVLKTGSVKADQSVRWNPSVDVKTGDFFTITPGIVHELENNFSEKLILIVTCSPSHLEDNRIVLNSKKA